MNFRCKYQFKDMEALEVLRDLEESTYEPALKSISMGPGKVAMDVKFFFAEKLRKRVVFVQTAHH